MTQQIYSQQFETDLFITQNVVSKRSARKVLFVLGRLWGENGITAHLHTLGKGLIEQGWQVAVASDLPSNLEGATEEAQRAVRRLEKVGIQYFPVAFPELKFSARNVARGFQTFGQLDQVIRSFKPDIIHTHALAMTPYLKGIQLYRRVPIVFTCHMEPSEQRFNVRLGKRINQWQRNLFGDRMIAISSTLQTAFEQMMHVPTPNIRLIYHGSDDRYFRKPSAEERVQARNQYHLDPEEKVVCLIGRLENKKGHWLLIDALAHLKQEGLSVTALFAGRGYGEEEEIVQRYAQEKGVMDQIRFLGFTDPRQVLWASDIKVLPSAAQSEAFPLVIPEAMLCGVVPIRTPASGAIDQIQDGQTGFIIPFNDCKALATRLQEVLWDKNLYQQLSNSAHAYSQQNFTARQMITSTISLYEELLV